MSVFVPRIFSKYAFRYLRCDIASLCRYGSADWTLLADVLDDLPKQLRPQRLEYVPSQSLLSVGVRLEKLDALLEHPDALQYAGHLLLQLAVRFSGRLNLGGLCRFGDFLRRDVGLLLK